MVFMFGCIKQNKTKQKIGESVSIVGTALYHGMEGSVQTGASEVKKSIH